MVVHYVALCSRYPSPTTDTKNSLILRVLNTDIWAGKINEQGRCLGHGWDTYSSLSRKNKRINKSEPIPEYKVDSLEIEIRAICGASTWGQWDSKLLSITLSTLFDSTLALVLSSPNRSPWFLLLPTHFSFFTPYEQSKNVQHPTLLINFDEACRSPFVRVLSYAVTRPPMYRTESYSRIPILKYLWNGGPSIYPVNGQTFLLSKYLQFCLENTGTIVSFSK